LGFRGKGTDWGGLRLSLSQSVSPGGVLGGVFLLVRNQRDMWSFKKEKEGRKKGGGGGGGRKRRGGERKGLHTPDARGGGRAI